MKEFVSSHKVNLFCLQETKCEEWNKSMKNSVWEIESHDWVFQKSLEYSGGLASSWNTKEFTYVGLAQEQNWIWTQLKHDHSQVFLNIINVYSPLSFRGKMTLWEEIKSIPDIISEEAACVIGDFNCVRNSSERLHCDYRIWDSEKFNVFVKNWNLLYLELANASFTWFGPKGKRSRLDRVFLNTKWYCMGQWIAQTLCRKQSDHRPLLLKIKQNGWGPKPFKVFNWWLKEQSLIASLNNFWNANLDLLSLSLQDLLRRVKLIMKRWCPNTGGELECRIKALENKLDFCD
ncbi:hypothetical protein POM88_037320 [Heracleum sosnowskyi]|uniref:Endonuclease/exonuclease/phosphatase domain-containing protein n=1 Tax=Heracleum sosnowskyi TaxID=360622 RepID=A0AAD8HQV9_9APIA|nr:hypothetical protein POM88_037320 [Heracleum sosnowskyi]